MAYITQGNKQFFPVDKGNGITWYYVSEINGRLTQGREGSYMHLMCDLCGRIIGTQFDGFSRHEKACKKKNDEAQKRLEAMHP